MSIEFNRRQNAYNMLDEKYKVYLPEEVWNEKQQKFKNCILANARFLA